MMSTTKLVRRMLWIVAVAAAGAMSTAASTAADATKQTVLCLVVSGNP